MVRWRTRTLSWRDIAAICCCCGRDGTAVQRALGLKLISEEEQQRLLHAYNPETDRLAGSSDEPPEASKAAAAAAAAAAMYPFRSRGSLRYIGEAFLFDDLLNVPSEVRGSRSCLACRASLISPLEPEGGIVLRLRKPRVERESRGSRESHRSSSREWNVTLEGGREAQRISSLAHCTAAGASLRLSAKRDEGRYREDNSTVETLTTSATSVEGKRSTGVGSCFSRGSEDLSSLGGRSADVASFPRDVETGLRGQQSEIPPKRLLEADGIRITDLVHRERRRAREEGREAETANSESDEDEFLFFPTRLYSSASSRGQSDVRSASGVLASLTSRQAGGGVVREDSRALGSFSVGQQLGEQHALRGRGDLAAAVSSSEARETRSEGEGPRSEDGDGVAEQGDFGRRAIRDVTQESPGVQHSPFDAVRSRERDLVPCMARRSAYDLRGNPRHDELFVVPRILEKQQGNNQGADGVAERRGNAVPGELQGGRRLSHGDRESEGNLGGLVTGGRARTFTRVDSDELAPGHRGAVAAGLLGTDRRSAAACTASRGGPGGQSVGNLDSEAGRSAVSSPPNTALPAKPQPYRSDSESTGTGQIVGLTHFQSEPRGGTRSRLLDWGIPGGEHRGPGGRSEGDLEEISRSSRCEGVYAGGYPSFTGHFGEDGRALGMRSTSRTREDSRSRHGEDFRFTSSLVSNDRSFVRELSNIDERSAHDLSEVKDYERSGRGGAMPREREPREHSQSTPADWERDPYSTAWRALSTGGRPDQVCASRAGIVKDDVSLEDRRDSLTSRGLLPSDSSRGFERSLVGLKERQAGRHATDAVRAADHATGETRDGRFVVREDGGTSFARQSKGGEERMKKEDEVFRSPSDGRGLAYHGRREDMLDTARDDGQNLRTQATREFFTPRACLRSSVSSSRAAAAWRAESTGYSFASITPFTSERYHTLPYSDRSTFSWRDPSSIYGTDSRGYAVEDMRGSASLRSSSVGSRLRCDLREKDEVDPRCQTFSGRSFSKGPTALSPRSLSAGSAEPSVLTSRGAGWPRWEDPEAWRRGVERDTREQQTYTGTRTTDQGDRRAEHGPVVAYGHPRFERSSEGGRPGYLLGSGASSPGKEGKRKDPFLLRTLEACGDHERLSERRAYSESPVTHLRRGSLSPSTQFSGECGRPPFVGRFGLSGTSGAARDTAEGGERKGVGRPRPAGASTERMEEVDSSGRGSYSDHDSLYLTPRED